MKKAWKYLILGGSIAVFIVCVSILAQRATKQKQYQNTATELQTLQEEYDTLYASMEDWLYYTDELQAAEQFEKSLENGDYEGISKKFGQQMDVLAEDVSIFLINAESDLIYAKRKDGTILATYQIAGTSKSSHNYGANSFYCESARGENEIYLPRWRLYDTNLDVVSSGYGTQYPVNRPLSPGNYYLQFLDSVY